MNARRVEITLDQETWDRLETARGHEPRASFVRRALESALGSASATGLDSRDRASRTETVIPPASSRASETTPREVQALKNFAETTSQHTPGVARASSLAKRNVKPIPKGKS